MRLVLASSSPRRLALLAQAGITPDLVLAPDVEERALTRELPPAMARRLAEAKLSAVAEREPDAFVLAADTVVACGRRALDKTETLEAARAHLKLISGRRHQVITAVAVTPPRGRAVVRLIRTAVRLKRLHETEIEAYLATGEWRGKAGAYAIQGAAEAFVIGINGSYSNVVGLPLCASVALLRGLGWQPR
ncbi:MAG: Maf family protein [Geminicoccaceae bacterium]